MNKEKEHKRMGRPPVGVPEHIKKFRATEEEWKEFLELCPDDSREAFQLVLGALREFNATTKRLVDAELKLEPWRAK
jgi:hypothetical protein